MQLVGKRKMLVLQSVRLSCFTKVEFFIGVTQETAGGRQDEQKHRD